MLTRTVVQVGHDLGIEIVAEGIERPEQLELLRAMGCGLGQGFLVARPMTAQRIESLAALDGHGPASLRPTAPTFPAPDDALSGPAAADPTAAPSPTASTTGL
jgi:predicted signal transduction protein with EAL and GGDEF domain